MVSRAFPLTVLENLQPNNFSDAEHPGCTSVQHCRPCVEIGLAEGVCVLAWCQGDVLMEQVRPMLDECGYQDVEAGAHMEGLNCSCSCRIQTQLHDSTPPLQLARYGQRMQASTLLKHWQPSNVRGRAI